MKNQLIRAITKNDAFRVVVVNATQLVEVARQKHDTWHTATAALGRTLVATSLLSATEKGDGKISVEIDGDGPVGRIVTEGRADGSIKGFISQPHVALDLNEDGKLDVRGAVGTQGTLTVRKHIADYEPFSGQVPLISGELGEDFTYYMAASEQTPAAIGLSVLINPDETVQVAGGFMIQVMPGAGEDAISQLEKNLSEIEPLSDLFDKGATLFELLDKLVGKDEYKVLAEGNLEFCCDCSKKRFSRGLIALGQKELIQIIEEDGMADTVCHFCNQSYHFTKEELLSLASMVDKSNDE